LEGPRKSAINGERLFGLVAGTLTGMVLGLVLSCGTFLAVEQLGLARFHKEPLLLIPLLGCPAGGLVGGYVSVRLASRRNDPPRRDGDDQIR
jgi:hypothetical protein